MPSTEPRLRERRIVQWGLGYLGAAWLLYQVVDAMADPWGVPAGVLRGLSVLLAAGFLAVLVVSWFHGDRGRQRVSAAELVSIAVIGAAGVTGAVLASRSAGGEPAARSGARGANENTVAVLPFVDLSPGQDHGYFADGIAEEIISALTRDGRVRVAARTSSFTLRDRPVSEVGATLGVATVLEGSVRRDGTTARITAQLVDTGSGFEIWSRSFDRPMQDVLSIQSEIADAVVAELTGFEVVAQTATLIDPAAYEQYLRGRFFWNRRTEEDLLRARTLFEGAIQAAPEYARAVSGLADTYAILGFYQWLPPDEAFPAAERFARRALDLDPGLADPHATIAYAKTYHEWDWAGAEASFRSAIDLNGQYPVAHQWYGNLLTVLDRGPEAEAEFVRALELDPLSLIAQAALAWSIHYSGDSERATALLDQLLALEPGFLQAWAFQGWSLVQSGRTDDAVASFERAVEISDSSATSLAGLAYARARAGDTGAAEALLAMAQDPERTRFPPPYEIGKVYLGLGRVDEAVQWFERGYHERANQLVLIAVDPVVEPYRDDPRIRSIVERLGL